MTTWKVRRVVVEVQEGFVEAATADDAAILGNHMGVYSPLDKHITVFDVVAEPPADPDMFSEVTDPDMRT